jgi:hypothetical protein
MPNTLPLTLPREDRENLKLGLTAEMLRHHGVVQLKAWGSSMLPSIWPGDLLTIQSAPCDEVVSGDIVLVMHGDRFLIHRLVERRQVQDCLSWITKGDSILHDDPPVGASELLGRVVEVKHGNRSFVPSRQLSRAHSMLAWMLCRWDCFRSLALRIRPVSVQAGPRVWRIGES